MLQNKYCLILLNSFWQGYISQKYNFNGLDIKCPFQECVRFFTDNKYSVLVWFQFIQFVSKEEQNIKFILSALILSKLSKKVHIIIAQCFNSCIPIPVLLPPILNSHTMDWSQINPQLLSPEYQGPLGHPSLFTLEGGYTIFSDYKICINFKI